MDVFLRKVVFILFFIAPIALVAVPLKNKIDSKWINPNNSIKTGADNYEKYLPILKNKKTAIVTNQTGILSNKIHLVDFLLEKNVTIQTIFAPEHGFRGTADAGEHVVDSKDKKTGLPIVSLYGDNKKPNAEQLKGIEIMIFDLQDVGVRFYTYISTLHYVMEACAENNIQLLILDRPNPNGNIVDGPLLETEFSSFVGMHPIPMLHGMTIGEYAQMINGQKWLKNKTQCKLTVIPCSNYNRNMAYSLLVKPSPNLPNDQSINLYASLCLFEGTNVSVGRGTEKQFQIYGSPYMQKGKFSFIPKPNFGAKNPLHNGKTCYGKDLSQIKKIKQLEIKWLLNAYQETTDKTTFFNAFFTKLAGTKKLQQQIENGVSENNIRKTWANDLTEFREMRKQYLLYR
ncbi:exo-beta-N-acetylmuramidase NamZ domain-containing protein [Flavobacterium frigoris]|uniref:DUF1343 domain-containing protein n=1 Tax=Flavobacterium frigoris (strain PS1) TaxID=1086011 RepID=H7FT40_FLAFP|nr:DUF1343 domain-containing protein [Flavobacterium frigoris]EIA08737.1 hypothetical protein HJ01_02459 [Flavobacterium frigoris PS1]